MGHAHVNTCHLRLMYLVLRLLLNQLSGFYDVKGHSAIPFTELCRRQCLGCPWPVLWLGSHGTLCCTNTTVANVTCYVIIVNV
jgi:hypothetical protein